MRAPLNFDAEYIRRVPLNFVAEYLRRIECTNDGEGRIMQSTENCIENIKATC